jgi:hypothetical protein
MANNLANDLATNLGNNLAIENGKAPPNLARGFA